MKLDYIGCCFRITVEFFGGAPALTFRKYRVEPGGGEYEARRKLLRDVRAKIKEPLQSTTLTTLTRPSAFVPQSGTTADRSATLSRRMGEGWGEGIHGDSL